MLLSELEACSDSCDEMLEQFVSFHAWPESRNDGLDVSAEELAATVCASGCADHVCGSVLGRAWLASSEERGADTSLGASSLRRAWRVRHANRHLLSSNG